jgi:elongation factor G
MQMQHLLNIDGKKMAVEDLLLQETLSLVNSGPNQEWFNKYIIDINTKGKLKEELPNIKEITNTRKIIICAHIDSGKTTLTERLLFETGVTVQLGEVHDGKATMDFLEEERRRGITITAAATVLHWKSDKWLNNLNPETKIHLIDTPGHVDFSIEVERSMRVTDSTILIIPPEGVRTQTESVCRRAIKYNLPTIIYINKLDRKGITFEYIMGTLITSIKQKLKLPILTLQIPVFEGDNFIGIIDLIHRKYFTWKNDKAKTMIVSEIPSEELQGYTEQYREEMLNILSDTDDEILEKVLNNEDIDVFLIEKAIRKATINRTVYPLLIGSAYKNIGIPLILDAIVKYLPNPLERLFPTGKLISNNNSIHGNQVIRYPNDKVCAFVFKKSFDNHGALIFIAVYSGVLKSGDTLVVNGPSGYNQKVIVRRMVQLHANQQKEITRLHVGEIGALLGVKLITGDTLCDPTGEVVSLKDIDISEPVLFISVTPKTKSDQEKMSNALSKIKEEDPSLVVKTNSAGQTLLGGVGELHLEHIVNDLESRYGVDVECGKPAIEYLETLTSSVQKERFSYVHKKQSGGAGQFAAITIDVSQSNTPGITFVDKLVGQGVDKVYVPSLQKGILARCETGPVLKSKMTGLEVTFIEGQQHAVDSSDIAFQICGNYIIGEALEKLNARGLVKVLEPMVKVSIETPTEYTGTVSGSISELRGVIENSESDQNNHEWTIITAVMPAESTLNYISELRSSTQGRATFTQEFDSYQQVPDNIIKKKISTPTS